MSALIFEKVKNYKNIIWDWNGTLIDDSSVTLEVEAELFPQYGLPPLTKEQREALFCFPIEKYYQRVGFDFSKYSYEEVGSRWLEIYEIKIAKAPLFEGVPEMLKAIQELRKSQFILSAAPESHVKQVTVERGITHHFEAIYALAHAKADSKVQRGVELVRDYKIEIENTILVGDTLHDLEVGKNLGVDVLLVAGGHHRLEDLQQIHANVLQTRY